MSSVDVVPATPKSRDLSKWLASLSTPAGLAILSVVSLIAGAIIQDIRSQRELNRAWLQERSKHQMAVRKSFLDEQTAAVDQLYEAVSSIRETSVSLIDLTRPDFDDKSLRDRASRTAVEEQRQRVRKAFNLALDQWEHTQFLSAYRLNTYTGDDTLLQARWSDTRAAATALADCASEWYLQAARGAIQYRAKPCLSEESALERKWNGLSVELRATRRAAWRDWETPPVLLR